MSWMKALYETYENCEAENLGILTERTPLLPICHSQQNSHIHIILDEKGDFRSASVIPKAEASCIIPVTEGSAGRAGAKVAPHPLFDKLQYVTHDYVERGGKREGFPQYKGQLDAWCDGPNSHPKVRTVRDYVAKMSLVSDLVKHGILYVNNDGSFVEKWTDPTTDIPPIFGVIPSKDQREAFILFSVEIPGDRQTELCSDKTVWESWIKHYSETNDAAKGLCFVTGEESSLAVNHPKRIRHSGDGAKLISSNDKTNFTFRGRFTDAAQVCGINHNVTQKAHSALRWLIARQGMQDNGLAVVAWSVKGKSIPDPWADTDTLLDGAENEGASSDAGLTIGRRFSKLMAGYKATLGDTDQVVVMALDSATPGRMAIKYYRELTGSDYLARIELWHRECAWEQWYGKGRRTEGAPSPKMITLAAYGTRASESLRKATIERILPCIIDSAPIPRDLVDSCVRRASNRVGLEPWEWEQALGVACALYRYINKGEYIVALEADRQSRDYLYGRLLALADHAEKGAYSEAEKNRETTATRLMQRFADRPYSTWRNVELALQPYLTRLKVNKPWILHRYDKGMEQVTELFNADNFTNDSPLTGEFLLGFHCQRTALWKKSEQADTQNED